MTEATRCALLLLGAGWLQSFIFVMNKLPGERRPPGYPSGGIWQLLLNLVWIALFGWGIALAFRIDLLLGIVAVPVYFLSFPKITAEPMGAAQILENLIQLKQLHSSSTMNSLIQDYNFHQFIESLANPANDQSQSRRRDPCATCS